MEKTKEEIEKESKNAGGLEMAFLEKYDMDQFSNYNSSYAWIYCGTVVGMIKAFEDIKMANDISCRCCRWDISGAINNSIWFNCGNDNASSPKLVCFYD